MGNEIRDEIRDLAKRIRALEAHLRSLETDAAYPDITERLITEHEEKIQYHQRQIAIIRENAAPKPERVEQLRKAISNARKRLALLQSSSKLQKMLKLQREINALEGELGEVAEGEDRDEDDDSDESALE